MASSGLQNYQKIKNCAENVEQYMPLEIAINASRAAMYKAIQPNPGYFPHIFLDGTISLTIPGLHYFGHCVVVVVLVIHALLNMLRVQQEMEFNSVLMWTM